MFIVQGTTDAPEYESNLQTASRNKETQRNEDIPVKPAGYETLMDVKSESDSSVKVGTSADLKKASLVSGEVKYNVLFSISQEFKLL